MAEKKIKKEKIDNVGIHSFSKKADIFFSIISGLIALSCILPFIFVIILDIVVYRTIRFESKNDIPIVPPTEEDIYAETQLSRPSPIVEMTDNVSEREKM